MPGDSRRRTPWSASQPADGRLTCWARWRGHARWALSPSASAAPTARGLARGVEIAIEPLVGPEVITGSTRMKAGTATKLVLKDIP